MTGASNEKADSFLGYFIEAPRALYHIVSDNSIGKVRIDENRNNLNNDIKFVIYSWNKCEIGDLANDFLNIKINNNFSEIWNQQENYFKNKDDTNEIKKYFDEFTRKQFDFYKDRYDRMQSYDLLDSINIEQQKVENLKSSLMAKQLEAVSLNDSVNTAIEDYAAWDTLCTDC